MIWRIGHFMNCSIGEVDFGELTFREVIFGEITIQGMSASSESCFLVKWPASDHQRVSHGNLSADFKTQILAFLHSLSN